MKNLPVLFLLLIFLVFGIRLHHVGICAAQPEFWCVPGIQTQLKVTIGIINDEIQDLFQLIRYLRDFMIDQFTPGIQFSNSPVVRYSCNYRNVFLPAIIQYITISDSLAVDDNSKIPSQLPHSINGQLQIMQAKRSGFRYQNHKIGIFRSLDHRTGSPRWRIIDLNDITRELFIDILIGLRNQMCCLLLPYIQPAFNEIQISILKML